MVWLAESIDGNSRDTLTIPDIGSVVRKKYLRRFALRDPRLSKLEELQHLPSRDAYNRLSELIIADQEDGEQDASWLIAIADSLEALSDRMRNEGLIENSIAPERDRVEILRRLVQDGQENSLILLADGLSKLTSRLEGVGYFEEALACATEANQNYADLVQDRPDLSSNLANTQTKLGRLLAKSGLQTEALRASSQAVDTYQRLVAEDPDSKSLEAELVMSLINLGKTYSELGGHKEALDTLLRAAVVRKRLAATTPNISESDISLGSISLKNSGRELFIHGCELKSIPADIGKLTSLEKLDIRSNQLKSLPESLGQLTNLRELDVRGNQLTNLPESLGQLTNLRELDARGNQLKSLWEGLGQLTNLRRLDIRSNQLTNLPESLGQLTNLRRLDSGSNQLTNLPGSLGQLTNLRELDVRGNQLRSLPESLGQLTNLRRLDIRSNQLASLPEGLGQLTNLQRLDSGSNQLANLPGSLGQLTNLRELDVRGNQLRSLPESLGQLTDLRELDVRGNQLRSLSESLGQLRNLRRLDIRSNQLRSLPESLGQLTDLRELDVEANQLASLPESLGQLRNLRRLDIRSNQLRSLPESLGQLTNLQELDVEANQLRNLSESLGRLRNLRRLFLHENFALGIPPEVLGPTLIQVLSERKGEAANPARIIEYYFNSRASRPLNEAKMILVGRGGVGKTSLVQQLVLRSFSLEENMTTGVAITEWTVPIGDEDIRLNIWDFGGQEIMHATHQFFLTKRSLYLLVLNAREGEQDASVEYWLRLIESFGGDSPVIVIINKIKDHHFDLNRRGLQEKFPAIRAFIQTDCEAGIGIDDLQRAIVRETDRLEHLRDPFPASWFAVKDKLADLDQNFITYSEYLTLCQENGITETTSQETLVGFLHDLGIVVNFRDNPRLAETHVLKPGWVTNGIYKILNAESIAEEEGTLRFQNLSKLLDPQDYPRDRYQFLLDLMEKFELSYEYYGSRGEYLVPELLGKEEPELAEFDGPDALRFEYHYNILPEGLLPRFIVRSRALNKDLPRWRTGAVLTLDGNTAVIKADIQDRKVSIAVIGEPAGRRRLLSVIRSDFEHLHGSIARLQSDEYVPIPGQQKAVVAYVKLRKMEAAGISTFPEVIGDNVVELNVTDLLNGVEEAADQSYEKERETGGLKEAVRVVFSYAHKDEELRDRLGVHIRVLERRRLIRVWYDREIKPGEKWADIIDDNFKRADLIFLLVSADFLDSDYCYQMEMQTALEREKNGEAQVVPIILEDCLWREAPFGYLQALPKDGKSVTSWDKQAEAWRDVAEGIKTAAEEIRRKRG